MPKKTLVGQLVVANPLNPADGREFGVTLIVSDDREATVGVQINRPITNVTLAQVCKRVGLVHAGVEPIYRGGIVNRSKIYVIHGSDWQSDTTSYITDQLSITNDHSILTSICSGTGPKQFRACAGFWIWPPGQLRKQILAGPQDPGEYRWETINGNLDNVFNNGQHLDQWHASMELAAQQHVHRLWPV